jgi:hypothetical protein
MAAQENAGNAKELVWRPTSRAFFVYYVAIAVAVLGPRINPEVGVPPWAGVLAGLALAVAVILGRFGQEYRATPTGLERVGRWPSKEEAISWPEVGEMVVQRGLTQTLLNVGSVVIHDKQGAARLTWERLADPQGVRAALEARRITSPAGVAQRGEAD